jgi:excisionase family DNA binding protein
VSAPAVVVDRFELDEPAAEALARVLRLLETWSDTHDRPVPGVLLDLRRGISDALTNPDSCRIVSVVAEARHTVEDMNQTTTVPTAITLDEAADALGVSRRTVERLVATNALRSVKIRGARRVPAAEIERLLEAKPE